MFEAEVRNSIGTGLPYATYVPTGRIRLVVWGRPLPFAQKTSRLGRFYLWLHETAWRYHIWRLGEK